MIDQEVPENVNNESSSPGRFLFAAVSVVLFIVLFAQLWFHAARTSVTVDEPVHILAGYRHLQCGDFGINPEHPPLLKILAASPLMSRELKQPPWNCGSQFTSKFDSFSYGSSFLADNGMDAVVIPTRLAASLTTMVLGLLVFLAAWEMFGKWEALTALTIVAFEPNFLGNGSIVNTDMAISATAFGAMYAIYRYGKDATWPNLGIAGLAVGFMLASKHSAVIFVAILFVALIVDAVLSRKAERGLPDLLARRTAAFAGILIIGLTILWTFYGFRYRAIPNESVPPISVAEYIRENGRPEMVESVSARATELVSGLHVLPESYVLGMADVISWGSRNTVLFGKNYPTGKWFYFPVAFVVKTNIALLFLFPVGLVFLWTAREKWREGLYLLMPAVAFFVFASASNFTTNIRHILPVFGLLIVLASAGAIWLCRKFRVFQYVLAALLVLDAAAAIRTAPNHLVFSNVFWGGYENTYKIMGSDIGQSMKAVSEYLGREGVSDCWIATFVHPEMIGSVQPCRPMPSGVRIMVSRNLIDPVPPVIEGTVVLTEREFPPSGPDEYVPITRSEPVAFVAGNTFIYRGRFEIPLAAAISRVHRSNHFRRVDDIEHAIDEALQAIDLAPGDPRTHLALGQALSRTEQKDDARREFEIAVDLARKDSRFRNVEVWAGQALEKLR